MSNTFSDNEIKDTKSIDSIIKVLNRKEEILNQKWIKFEDYLKVFKNLNENYVKVDELLFKILIFFYMKLKFILIKCKSFLSNWYETIWRLFWKSKIPKLI